MTELQGCSRLFRESCGSLLRGLAIDRNPKQSNKAKSSVLFILTNTCDPTADYLVSILELNSLRFLRFDTDAPLSDIKVSLEKGALELSISGAQYSPWQFSNVWYRRPEPLSGLRIDDVSERRFVAEEWTEALEGFLAHIDDAKWMNPPSRNVRASNKIEQLTRARSIGLATPDTLVTQNPEKVRQFFTKHGGHIIAKSLARGRIERERDSLIYTTAVLEEHLTDLTDLESCPTLFQQQIEKASDIRITVVDNDVHAVSIVGHDNGEQRCDIRRNNMVDVSYTLITLPAGVRLAVLELVKQYELRFAAIDMAVAKSGEWFFFEVNPNGQWAWLDLEGVTNIAASFVEAFRY